MNVKGAMLLGFVALAFAGGAATHQVADYAELKALFEGGTLAEKDTVELTGARYDFTEVLTLPKKNLTLRGARANGERPILSGGGVSSGFFPTAGSAFRDLVFTNFTSSVTKSEPATWGTAIRYSTTDRYAIENCLFTHCVSPTCGGAVGAYRVEIHDTAFVSNVAQCAYSGTMNGGGALAVNYSGTSLVISGCRFEGNRCTPSSGNNNGGGAVLAHQVSAYLTNVVFVGNSSACHAGAYYGDPKVASNVTFVANSAVERGGAVGSVNPGSRTSVYLDCLFEANRANGYGGAIYAHNQIKGGVTATNCTFRGNFAVNYGGAIDCDSQYLNALVGCRFLDNKADSGDNTAVSYGGAIGRGGARLIEGCLFSNNVTKCYGGAIHWGSFPKPSEWAECVVTNSTFIDNAVSGRYGNAQVNMNHAGGAISADSEGPVLRIDGCTFRGNYIRIENYQYTHHAHGSAVMIGTDTANAGPKGCRILNCDFTANSLVKASNGHGAVFLGGWTNLVANCTFTANTNETANAFGAAVSTSAASTKAWNTVSNCTFTLNLDGKGSASATGALVHYQGGVAILDCVFSSNTVTSAGGGAIGHYQQNIKQRSRSSNLLIDRCAFYDNTSPANGGAIYLTAANDWNQGGTNPSADYTNATSFLTANIRNSLFVRNSSPNAGGAIYLNSARDVVVENCTFVSNRTTQANKQGGAVYLGASYAPRSTISAVNVSVGGITNCLFFGNTINGSRDNVNAHLFCNSAADMCGHDFEQVGPKNFLTDGLNGNLVRDDPGFADAAADDYSLKRKSICVNAGTNALWMTTARDLRNNRRIPRILYDCVDIGAYEMRVPPGLLLFVQ